MSKKKSIAVIGGGASALSFASFIDTEKYDVTIYEKNSALGRKFLVAGSGGFNLTHSESMDGFSLRYTPHSFIKPFLEQFTNTDFRNWLQKLGIETYIGTSKRVFPIKGIKPIQVLQAIEKHVKTKNILFLFDHNWLGFENDQLKFSNNNYNILIKPDITVFALGGGSWKITGSEGEWLNYFKDKNVLTENFEASNGAFKIEWKKEIIKQIEGKIIKNASFSCDTKHHKGEAVLTTFGIEGSGIYALSNEVRQQLKLNGSAKIYIDFKPQLTKAEIKERIEQHLNLSMKEVLDKKLNINETQILLLKNFTSRQEYHDAEVLSSLIKAYPLTISDLTPIDEAISTVGGISLDSVTDELELKKMPNHYSLGEMLNWDAPTGGYLLQACFSMGYVVALNLNSKS